MGTGVSLSRPSHDSRRWLAGWLIVSWLFMQLAVAAYACPLDRVGSAVEMAAMPDCPYGGNVTLDAAAPQLCKAHCERGTQLPPSHMAADAPPAPLLWAVLDWSQQGRLPASLLAMQAQRPSGAAPPGGPPLYLILQVLRN